MYSNGSLKIQRVIPGMRFLKPSRLRKLSIC